MNHPFSSIPTSRRGKLLLPLVLFTLAMSVVMQVVGAPLKTGDAPSGIVSFELAGNVQETARVLASWDEDAHLRAAFIQGLDFLYLFVYSFTIGLGCIWASGVLKMRQWPLASLGVPLAWGLWLAAFLDAIENVALVIILFGMLASPWPEIARWCALLKFALIGLGILYVVYGILAGLIMSSPKKDSATF